jgi:hypothetical protein
MLKNKNLLSAFVVVSTVLSSGTFLYADNYKKIENLPAERDLIPNNESLKMAIDQVLSTGDHAGDLFKAHYYAVNFKRMLDQAAKEKTKKPNADYPDLTNPAIAASEIIKGIVGLLGNVKRDPQIASGIITECFKGDRESDGSILRGFLSAENHQGYIANNVSSYESFEKFRREVAIFTRNLARCLPVTRLKWDKWDEYFRKIEARADKNRSA